MEASQRACRSPDSDSQVGEALALTRGSVRVLPYLLRSAPGAQQALGKSRRMSLWPPGGSSNPVCELAQGGAKMAFLRLVFWFIENRAT